MRSMHEIAADVEMIRQAKSIREWLCHLSGLIPRLNERPNPYYGTTLDGLVLIHYYGGPSSVGTPFGEWSCTGGGCLKNADWFEEAKERLGLVEVMPERQISDGCFGPVHAITKDLDGNPVRQCQWELVGIGIPGIRTRSIWGTKSFPNMIDAISEANRIGLSQESLDYAIGNSADWADSRRVSLLGSEICGHYWREMKLKVGHKEWDDEKEVA